MESIFRKTLRAELDYQDIKVKELSARTGISSRTIEGYLNARGSIPPADIAVKIAQVLNVSVEYLITGDSNLNYKNNRLNNNSLEEKIALLSIEKRKILRGFVNLLEEYDLIQKNKK